MSESARIDPEMSTVDVHVIALGGTEFLAVVSDAEHGAPVVSPDLGPLRFQAAMDPLEKVRAAMRNRCEVRDAILYREVRRG